MQSSTTRAKDPTEVLRTIGADVRAAAPAHLPLYLTAIVFVGVTLGFAEAYDLPVGALDTAFNFLRMLVMVGGLIVAIAAAFQFVAMIRRDRPESPLRHFLGWLGDVALKPGRPGHAVHAMATIMPMMISFTVIKDAVPRIHPFVWDRTLSDLDRALHFGVDPWRLLEPLLRVPEIVMTVNVVYNAWLFVMFGCLFWQAFSTRPGPLRLQFLLAFCGAWFLGGNLFALVFSSAGPCFYGRLGLGDDPYTGLMAHLHAANEVYPIWALKVQDMLWSSYATGDGLISGISAMPSLHVTTSFLMMFLAWRSGRLAAIALTAFAATIVIGSVLLGWHYALDAYAGMLLAILLWKVAGLVANRTLAVSERASPAALEGLA